MWLLFRTSFSKYLCLIISGPVGWEQCVIYWFLCIILFVSTSELYIRERKTHSQCQWCCPSGEKRRTNQLWLKSWHAVGINWTPQVQQVRTQTKSTVCSHLFPLFKKTFAYVHMTYIIALFIVHFISGANQKPNQYSGRGAGALAFKKGLTIPLTAAEVMLFNLMKHNIYITSIATFGQNAHTKMLPLFWKVVGRWIKT